MQRQRAFFLSFYPQSNPPPPLLVHSCAIYKMKLPKPPINLFGFIGLSSTNPVKSPGKVCLFSFMCLQSIILQGSFYPQYKPHLATQPEAQLTQPLINVRLKPKKICMHSIPWINSSWCLYCSLKLLRNLCIYVIGEFYYVDIFLVLVPDRI